jgi:alkaline phosphatase D
MIKTVITVMITFALLAVEPLRLDAEVLKKGDLETSLKLLNLGGKQSKSINSLYAAAHKVLAAKNGATFADLADDNEVMRLCKAGNIVHWGGPMLGSVTPQGARVWIRTVRPASVEVRVTTPSGEKSFGPVKSTRKSDMTAIVTVSGLKAQTRYPYRVLIDGKPLTLTEHAAIVTTPSNKSAKVRIAFGTCFHRWGLSNMKQVNVLRSRKPAAMLLYGDIAVQDRKSHLGLHRADYLLRDFQPAWRDLASSVPVYATWDDHDYFKNDGAGIIKGCTLADKQNVCDVFAGAWNNPFYGFGDERRGVFLRTRIGPCDVIMVDNRYFRENKAGSFLGDGQMKWLEAQLLDCKGPFIILSCGTMWSDYVSRGKDSWGQWDPKGRERIFKLIEAKRIAGVLLISGDRHGARGFRIPRPSGFKFYEFEMGSLGGRSGPPVTKPSWTEQFYGIAGKYAFGEFSIDATLADPTVTFRMIGDNGKVIKELKLKRSQLTPPAR